MSTLERNVFGLTERDMSTIEGIFEKYTEIRTVFIFGSRAKGNFRLGSDIDLAVMDTNLAPETISRLTHDFGDSSLPYFVDVVHFPSLTEQSLREHIERVGRLFYQQTTFAA